MKKNFLIFPLISAIIVSAAGCSGDKTHAQTKETERIVIETNIAEEETEEPVKEESNRSGHVPENEEGSVQNERGPMEMNDNEDSGNITDAFPDEDEQIKVTFKMNGKTTSLMLPMNYTANIYAADPENEEYVNRAFSTESVTLSKIQELNSEILIKRIDLYNESQNYSISTLPEDIIDLVEIDAERREEGGVRAFDESTDKETVYKAVIDEDEMGCAVYIRYSCTTDRHASFDNWIKSISSRITNK